MIVFDEIDAICKNRVHNDLVHHAVHDDVTTQFLSEIDGMAYLNNILVISTTNILKAIDPTLLRPGCIETMIKIEIPDAAACSNIFHIYRNALIHNDSLNQGVDIDNIN